ncbi:MAG TPA: N-acetylmuramoyl-L-alanine amidase [Lacibacter sp.]|nr:N-acetylmuramoyl-L-alanine amidase [Lacibacter sp.]
MKLLLPFFLLLHLSLFAQERNSETYREFFHFQHPAASNLKLVQTTNVHNTARTVVDKDHPVEYRFAAQQLLLKEITPFLSFSCGWDEINDDAGNSRIRIRFSTDKRNWTDWKTITTDEHYEKTKFSFVSQLMELDPSFRYYELSISSNLHKKGNSIQQIFLNFFSPGKSIAPAGRIANNSNTTTNRTTACSLPQPSFVNRAGWGCTQVWSPSTTTVTHLIVHHAAGTNSSSDWGAVVLAIWNQHTGTNGYSDIGYNWLIAPNGVLYEGRHNSSVSNVTGAHFCGANGATMGVCMLGDYTNITVTTATRATLAQLLAWKACERNIDPLAVSFHASSNRTINNISGHRDGCATQCPGNTFYPDLPVVRMDVANILNGTTLVASIDGLEEFSISPNPVAHTAILQLKLNTVKEVQYRIVSADGRIIYQSPKQKINGVWREELKVLNGAIPAVYTLQLWVNDEMISRSIIKQ